MQGEMFRIGGTWMKNTKADRRSQRTRQLLIAALIELMLKKRYDEITVQDIIDEANIGRSTFYAHYRDKQDLLVSNVTRVLDALSQPNEQLEGDNRRMTPSLALFFRHVQTHYQLYKALVRGGGIDLLYKKIHERLRQNIERHLGALLPAGQTPAAPLPLVADYVAGAIVTMLTWWLDNGMPYTPEQMDTMFYQLVLPGVTATLQIPADP
jgi:AcrR family transcriptional regulator